MATAKPWNPMEDAYKNQNFNKYTKGPGAELDENLQPGAMASGGMSANRDAKEAYQICLKNVPADMTEKALMNLCSHYAKVTSIRRSPKTPYIFIGFATLNDMERTLEGLKREKPQGIMADIAKQTASNISGTGAAPFTQNSGSNDRRHDRDRHSDSGSSQPDMSKRTIKGPFTNPQRPKFGERKPFVTEEDYQNSGLKYADPDRQCLVESDMHDRDRKPNRNQDDQEGGRKMHTGRAYYKDSKETTDNLQKLSAASKGNYNSEQFENDVAQIQYCNLCKNIADKICQRCGDYYCSIECQRKDWNRHRLFCFPMPELVAPVRASAPPQSQPPTSPHYDAPSHAPAKLNDSFESKQRNQNSYQNQDNRGGGGQNRGQRNTDQGNRNHQNNMEDRNQNRNNNYRDGGRNDKGGQENRRNDSKDATFEKKDSSFERKKESDYNRPVDFKKTQGQKNSNNDKTGDYDRKPNRVETVKPAPEETKKPAMPPKIDSAPFPKSGSLVAMTTHVKTNKVYVRSMTTEDNLEYVKTINLVNNEAKTAKTFTEMPKKGDYAITDFQGEGFYRVCVLNSDSADAIMVAYIDFGNVASKKLAELKEIPNELISLRRQALRVQLKNVEDFEPTDKIREYMESFVESKDLKLIYTGEPVRGTVEGELIDSVSNENLNNTINEMRVINPPALDDGPVMSKDIIFKTLPKSDKTSLVVLDTSLAQTGTISCILESDLIEIDSMTKQFADYVKNTSGPYTPRQSEICLVQYEDDLWYRAECIEVVGDRNPSVLFIDFGNVTTAHISKIRKYPRELIIPCVTIPCLIAGMPDDISTALADRLKELIPVNDKIIVDRVDIVDEQANLIHLDDIVNTLKGEKLI